MVPAAFRLAFERFVDCLVDSAFGLEWENDAFGSGELDSDFEYFYLFACTRIDEAEVIDVRG